MSSIYSTNTEVRDKPHKIHRVYCHQQHISIYSVFHMIISVFAIYLSFKCNASFDFLSFVAALCCPYLYILYKFATSEDLCGISK
jgi:hypothetical protein